ncbi:MAG: hypothetical protein OQL11_12720 [Gammaproteobacteria bacterium]|nr:hypothetical protein [Gammaproteobacteria bacterium]
MEMSKVSTNVTPALHPDNLKTIEGYDEHTAPYIAHVATAFSEAYEGIQAVMHAKQQAAKNPTWNEAMAMIHTDDFAQKKLARITRQFDASMSNLTKGIEAIEQQLATPLQNTGSTSISQEIRAHVKGLSTEDRHKFLDEAQKAGDHLTISAVLAAPGYLSGVSETERQVRTRLHHEASSPEVAKKLKVMVAARTMIEERAGLVFGQMEKAVGAPPHKVKALREAKSQAEAALILKEAL